MIKARTDISWQPGISNEHTAHNLIARQWIQTHESPMSHLLKCTNLIKPPGSQQDNEHIWAGHLVFPPTVYKVSPGLVIQASLQFAWLTLNILHWRQFLKLISHVNLVWAANSSTFSYSDGKKQWNPSRVNPNTGLSFPQQVEAIISWCFSPSSSRILLSRTESVCWGVGWSNVEPETKTMSSSICLSQEASQPK